MDQRIYRLQKYWWVIFTRFHPRAVAGSVFDQIANFVLVWQVDDDDSPEMQKQKDKPKLVVLGCGWGSVALLKNINPDNYHITVVSPSNYFLYTPLLPSATVGTLEVRSLVEPIRRITSRIRGHFLKAKAESVDFSQKLVEVSQTLPDGEERRFYLPYDKLVIGVGKFIHPKNNERYDLI